MFLFGNRLLMLTCTVYLVELEMIRAVEESNYCMCAEWGLWTEFGPCTAHCGGGLKSRNRQRLCRDDILYTSGEINCVKKTTQFQVCNTQECGCEETCTPWSKWSDGACTLQCGGGVLTSARTRQCHGTIGCSTKEEVTKDCNTEPCTGCVCNEWSAWSEYGPCSTVCGTGEQRRSRNRNCQPKIHCLGASLEFDSTYCNLGVCCDDACTAWSHWNDLGCSASCDYGTTNRTRNRVCALESCKDEEEAIGHCKTKSCPETCDSTCTQWATWSWSPCSESCDGGYKTGNRTRTCVFQDCLEEETSTVPCNTVRCSACNATIDCSEWGNWTEGYCSKSCDIGIRLKTRSRTCNAADCGVIDTYEEVCKEKTCTATCDSTCSAWSSWQDSDCSQSCDEGRMERHRNRTCVHDDCTTTDETSTSCNIKVCSGDMTNTGSCDTMCTQWSAWKSTECPVTCDGGVLTWNRTRQCLENTCSEFEGAVSNCNPQPCDEKCDSICSEWSAWSKTEDCSATCGIGQRLKSRTRICLQKECITEDKVSEECNLADCLEPGCNIECNIWSEWYKEPCSVSCGTGFTTKNRKRSCKNESHCPENESQKSNCYMNSCPENCDTYCGPWSAWFNADCSSSCGLGMRYRARGRKCSEENCPSMEELNVPCQEMACPSVIQNDQGSRPTQTTLNLCQTGLSTYIPHPTDCEKFIQCAFGRTHTIKCPDTTGWNTEINACDHKRNIPGCI